MIKRLPNSGGSQRSLGDLAVMKKTIIRIDLMPLIDIEGLKKLAMVSHEFNHAIDPNKKKS